MLVGRVTRDSVEVLATEFAARQRQGECPSIDEYVTRHPEFADEIRSILPTISALEKWKAKQQRTRDGRVTLAGWRLEQLGDFRIIREIGRGGMGIVYEAEQRSLSRRVAVKVLPRQLLVDVEQLRRFEREAKTAAALHHTNIVPVFGIGHDDGFHFYVMQMIDGIGLDHVLASLKSQVGLDTEESLTQVVRELLSRRDSNASDIPNASLQNTISVQSQSTVTDVVSNRFQPLALPKISTIVSTNRRTSSYWTGIAKIGIQIADAVQYAHANNTLHRDIKPSNIVIDSHGVCWVADFGLAKAIEDASISHTGSLAGTLAYMAPEQFRSHADARSDIYSLGLTLYELVTQQPAYYAIDRAQLLHKIMTSEPLRPRQIQPAIPRDLETILLKAMDREPNRRYQSAAALAEDLHRFLEDSPISARRSGIAERSWRYCRRNPVVAGLSATALMLVAMVAVSMAIGFANTRAALAAERIQRERAEAATNVAAQVLDRLYERFAPAPHTPRDGETDQDYEDKPVLSEGAAVVLEDMLVFYDRLVIESGEVSPIYREKIAIAYRRVGDIRHQLGRFDQAVSAYQQSLAIYRELDGSNHQAIYSGQIARIYNELGNIAHRSRKPGQARDYHHQAFDELKNVSDSELASDTSLKAEMERTEWFLRGPNKSDEPFGAEPPFHPRNGPPGPHHGPSWFRDPPPHGRPPGPR